MNDTFDYIMRFVVILFGYCCGLLATGWFLAAILFRSIGVDALLDDFVIIAGASNTEAATLWATTSFWSSVFVGGFIVAMLAGGISFLPAAIVILLAEARGYRSSVFYCVVGAVIGLGTAGSSIPFRGSGDWPDMPLWIAAFVGAGIVGGFIYWLVAGRNAGRLSDRPAG